jgi:hypothetical protein
LHEIRDKLALPSRLVSNDLRFGGMLPLFLFILTFFLRANIHYLFILHAEFSWHALDIVGLLWGIEKRLELAPYSKPKLYCWSHAET